MPMFIGEFLSNTLGLSDRQFRCYTLIFIQYWINKGPLSEDTIGRLLSTVPDNGNPSNADRDILAELFDTESIPEKWVHSRLDEEISKALKNRQSAKAKSQKATKARWKRQPGDVF